MAKRVIALFLVMIMGISLVACGGSSSSGSSSGATPAPAATQAAPASTPAAPAATGKTETFKIGVFSPLTGVSAEGAINATRSMALAVKRINDNGGFNGVPIETIIYDSQGNSEEAVKLVNRLISVDKVSICIPSHISSEILAVAPILQNASVLTVGIGTAQSWMAPDWPFIYRATINNNYTTPVVSGMAKEVGYTTYSVFTSTDEAAITTTDSFVKEAGKIGLKLLTRQETELAETEFAAQVAAVMRTDPDFVYLSTSGAATAHFARQIREAGYKGMFFNKESMSVSQIDIGGVENTSYCAFAWPTLSYSDINDCDLPLVKEVLQLYKDEYGSLPTSDVALRAWDAFMVLWEASKRAGSNDAEKMRAAMATIKMEGLGGVIDYTDGKREAFSALGFNQFILVNGKNILWRDWRNSGGFEAFQKATGHR